MEYDFHFKPVKFHESVKTIIDKHMFSDEIDFESRKDSGKEFLERLRLVKETKLDKFAMSLSGSDLELIFYALKICNDDSIKRKLLYILKHRMKKRFLALGWAVLQSDYRNGNLLDLMELICNYMETRHKNEFDRSLLSRIKDFRNNLLNESLEVLLSEGDSLKRFFRRYGVWKDSEFGGELRLLFFSKCNEEGFLENREEFLKVLDAYRKDGIIAALKNYLDRVEVLNFDDEVNSYIRHEISPPGEGITFWEDMNKRCREKFRLWMDIKKLEEYFGEERKVFNVFKEFYRDIKEIYRDEKKNWLIIDFGRLCVVCLGKKEWECFLCLEKAFKKQDDRYPDPEDLMKTSLHIVSARYAILEEIRSDVYRLSFEGAGILYAREILNREIA